MGRGLVERARHLIGAAYKKTLPEYVNDRLSEAMKDLDAWLAASPPEAKKRPEIVCLCGSTRFADQHAVKRWELERDGSAIVLMINYLPAWYADKQGWNGHDHYGEIAGNKSVLDELHFRKIDMADHVLVVNPGGYYGDSTRREIEYARSIGKPVAFTDGETGGAWLHDFGIYSYRCLVCGTTVDDAPVQPCKERSAAPTEASEEHEPLGDGPDTCFASPDGQLKCMEEEGHAGPHRDPFAPGGEVTWPVEPEGGER